MRKVIVFLCLIHFLFAFSVFAQTTEITNGLNYLTATQNPDGSWVETDTSVNTDFYSTAVIIDTLKILEQNNTQTYIKGVQWLSSYLVDNGGYLAWKILALTGENVELSADLNLLLEWQYEDGCWGGYDEYFSNNFHTALALQALKKINYSDQNTIDYASNYLISNQNADGGWGLQQGMDSEVYYTALISSTLQQFPKTTSIATAINKATSYLIAHQNTDGGFGGSPSTVYETSLAYLALVGETTDATVLGNAINYLTSTQLPNGSWDDDPYSTALALRALANVKPNLSISSSDITFSNPAPTAGEIITISANIKNTGSTQAPSTGSGYIVVQFYDGDPLAGGVLIGETTITSIPSFGSSQTSIPYTIPTASSKTIFVKIDPLNVIDNLYSKKIANKKGYLDTVNLKGSFGDAVNITYMQVTMFTKFIPT